MCKLLQRGKLSHVNNVKLEWFCNNAVYILWRGHWHLSSCCVCWLLDSRDVMPSIMFMLLTQNRKYFTKDAAYSNVLRVTTIARLKEQRKLWVTGPKRRIINCHCHFVKSREHYIKYCSNIAERELLGN